MTIISCQPIDIMFQWQIRTQCHNFRKYNLSQYYRVLVFLRNNETATPDWKQIERDYPEVKFYYYRDNENLEERFLKPTGYVGLLRPYMLANHFNEFPELEHDSILYIDSDILFTGEIDFTKYTTDNVCYLSQTRSYIGASYFESKDFDVLPGKLPEYRRKRVLDTAGRIVGITEDVIKANDLVSGGAQYLLKGMTSKFWTKVFFDTIMIHKYFGEINKEFFLNENKGIQRFCADMWALLWNLWLEGKDTQCPSDMDFVWAEDEMGNNIPKIYHDAGAGSRERVFLKHMYKHRVPYDLKLEDFDDKLMSHWYVAQVLEALTFGLQNKT